MEQDGDRIVGCSSKETYQVDYFQILLVGTLGHQNFFGNEIGSVRRISLEKIMWGLRKNNKCVTSISAKVYYPLIKCLKCIRRHTITLLHNDIPAAVSPPETFIKEATLYFWAQMHDAAHILLWTCHFFQEGNEKKMCSTTCFLLWLLWVPLLKVSQRKR